VRKESGRIAGKGSPPRVPSAWVMKWALTCQRVSSEVRASSTIRPPAQTRAERDTNAARGRVGSWAREGMKATDDPWAWAPGPRRAVLAYSLRRTAAKRKVKERGGAFGELPIRDLLSFARECPRTVDGRKAWHAAV
jgi:hypothetical protein